MEEKGHLRQILKVRLIFAQSKVKSLYLLFIEVKKEQEIFLLLYLTKLGPLDHYLTVERG